MGLESQLCHFQRLCDVGEKHLAFWGSVSSTYVTEAGLQDSIPENPTPSPL